MKLSLPHHGVCWSGGVVLPILTLALDRGKWSALCSGRFNPRQRATGTHHNLIVFNNMTVMHSFIFKCMWTTRGSHFIRISYYKMINETVGTQRIEQAWKKFCKSTGMPMCCRISRETINAYFGKSRTCNNSPLKSRIMDKLSLFCQSHELLLLWLWTNWKLYKLKHAFPHTQIVTVFNRCHQLF